MDANTQVLCLGKRELESVCDNRHDAVTILISAPTLPYHNTSTHDNTTLTQIFVYQPLCSTSVCSLQLPWSFQADSPFVYQFQPFKTVLVPCKLDMLSQWFGVWTLKKFFCEINRHPLCHEPKITSQYQVINIDVSHRYIEIVEAVCRPLELICVQLSMRMGRP